MINLPATIRENFFSKLMKTVWLYFAGLVAVIGLYYLLTGLEQGIDVLIQAGEYFWPGFFSVTAVFCGAGFLWYSARLLSYVKQQREYVLFGGSENAPPPEAYFKYAIPTAYHRHVPRLIAFNLFVVVQIAIFKLPNIGPDGGMFTFLMFAGHNAFYFAFTAWLERRKKGEKGRLLFFLCLIAVGGYLYILFSRFFGEGLAIADKTNAPLRYTYWLMLVAIFVFVLEVVGVFLVVWRKRSFGKNPLVTPGGRFKSFLNWIRVNPKHINKEVSDFGYFLIFIIIGLIIYFTTMVNLSFADGMGPLAFATIALAVLTSTANLISAFSIRWSVNLFVILIAVSFIFGLVRDPYIVRLEPTSDKKKAYDTRPDAANYLDKWFKAPVRTRLIEKAVRDSVKFPVYIVLSNGGASRAGSWTTRVLSHLQDSSYHIDPENQFADHIICLAGASGGTVGNSAFYSLLRARQKKAIQPDEFRDQTNEFFKTDFLTYTMAHLLGPDLFRHVMPLWIGGEDRAAALEEVMTFGPRDTTVSRYFDLPMSQVFDTSGELPIYFINTTQVDNGMPGVISSVKLGPKWLRSDVLSLVDQTGPKDGGMNIRLSTASVLSSRFPYVSPAGKVFDRYFVDGGYFDNSGAGTVYEFMQDLSSFFEKNPGLAQHVTLNILQITNSEQVPKPKGDIHPLTNDLAAPLLTLAGMQGSSTKIGTGILKTYFEKNYNPDPNSFILYSLYDPCWKVVDEVYEEGYPMSWVISDYQFDRTNRALMRENSKHLWKIYFSADEGAGIARIDSCSNH